MEDLSSSESSNTSLDESVSGDSDSGEVENVFDNRKSVTLY